MSNDLQHAVHDVIQQLFIDLGLGEDPATAVSWPVFAPEEPDSPDNLLRVRQTTGVEKGHSALTGEVFLHYGFQVLVRHQDDTQGSKKARGISNFMNQHVDHVSLTLDGVTYCVDEITTSGDIIYLGTQHPENRLHLFTINATVDLKRLS
jgi:hypothetical protein